MLTFRLRSRALCVVVAAVSLTFAGAAPAFAAGHAHSHHGGSGGGVAGSNSSGFDVSYPQCGTTLPTYAQFAIVGVNDGLANNLNPCLGAGSQPSELLWAAQATQQAETNNGTPSPLPHSVYVNTADPGNSYQKKPIADWPTSSSTADPFGSCTTTTMASRGKTYTVGVNSSACAWQYGYNKAQQDAIWLESAAVSIGEPIVVPTAASAYTWWFDVETANSWQSDTTMNAADLTGMVAALEDASVPVSAIGIYSTGAQWATIMGSAWNTGPSTLGGLTDWIPGATSLQGAQSNCQSQSFSGGTVTVTQWTGTIDNDNFC